MSLPQLAPKDRVLLGLAVTLTVVGKKIRFFTVHLKSACVSPLDRGRGRLDGNTGPNDPCSVQQQVAPLGAILEDLPKGVDHVGAEVGAQRQQPRPGKA